MLVLGASQALGENQAQAGGEAQAQQQPPQQQQPAANGADPDENQAPKIAAVRVVGNQTVSDGRLLSGLATRATNRFLFFGEVRRLDRAAVTQDTHRIRAVLQEEGFWAPSVGSQVFSVEPGEVEVQFWVEEGPPAIVASLLIDGMEELPPPLVRRVLSGNPLAEGDRWTQRAHQALLSQIQSRLQEEGYATAEVDGRVEVDPPRGVADVWIGVDPGLRYRIGAIEVMGNELVLERRILAAVHPILEPGDWFSPSKLREAQGEVFALGVFSTAVVAAGRPEPETGTIPVQVTVREADFLRLRLGAGAGIDQSYQQVRLLADFAHLDLFRGLQRLEFNNELAYRFLFGAPEVESGFAGRSSLQLTQPDIIGNNVDLAARLVYERELTLSYISQSFRGSLGTPIRLRRWLFLVPSYNIQRYFDVRSFTSPVVTGRPLPPVNCPNGCTFSFLEQRLVVDRRSDPLEPRTGYYAALGVQEGGGPLGGDFTWVRLTPEARGYIPLGPDWVLALRLELGYLQPLGDLQDCLEQEPTAYDLEVRCSPIVVRYFGGGAAGFRGAGAGRLSPLQAVEVGTGKDRHTVFVPLGGNSSFLATTELRWFLSPSWAAVAFVDAGQVAAKPLDAFRPSQFLYAVGGGVRARTPVGPIRLDLGYRLLRRHIEVVNSDQTLENHFIDWFSLYLSIGEAF